jgi:GNAT superfamily N-acetyltransferase
VSSWIFSSARRSALTRLGSCRTSEAKGVGSALLRTAEIRAISKGCRQLKVEAQNIHLPACRFYEGHGFVLRTVDRFAYPELPGEIQLLWYKSLSA